MSIQDALLKVKNTSQKPGPWSDTVTHTKKGVLGMEKTQKLFKEVSEMLETGTKINRPILESIRGFLIYVDSMY